MIRKIVAAFISFLMMAIMIIGVGFGFFKEVLATPSTYEKALQQIEAGSKVQIEVENALIDLMLVNNMPTDWVRDLVPTELVASLMQRNIYSVSEALLQQEVVSDTDEIEDVIAVFETRVREFLTAENKYLDSDDLANLELVKAEIKNILMNETMVLNPNLLAASSKVSKVSSLLQFILNLPILPCLMTGLVCLILLQLGLFFRQLAQGFRYSGMGIMAGGLLWFILGVSAKLSGFYEQPMIKDGYLKDLIVYLGDLAFTQFIQIGGIIFVIGMMLSIPYLIHSYYEFMLNDETQG